MHAPPGAASKGRQRWRVFVKALGAHGDDAQGVRGGPGALRVPVVIVEDDHGGAAREREQRVLHLGIWAAIGLCGWYLCTCVHSSAFNYFCIQLLLYSCTVYVHVLIDVRS